jgi:hypothetical protein
MLFIATPHNAFDAVMNKFVLSNSAWTFCTTSTSAARFDDAIHAHRWVTIATKSNQPSNPFASPRPACSPRPSSAPRPLASCIDQTMNTDSCVMCENLALPPTTDANEPDIWLPQSLALLLRTDDADSPPTSIICDTDYPVPESRPNSGLLLGCTFQDKLGVTHMRLLSAHETLAAYSFPTTLLASLHANWRLPNLLPSLAYSCPFGLANACTDTIIALAIAPVTDDHASGHSSFTKCLAYSATPPPDTADWMTAYIADPSTALIIATIGRNKAHT